MIIISDGIRTLEVTNGAYNGIYRSLGYKPVAHDTDAKIMAVDTVNNDDKLKMDDDKAAIDELMEKPVSMWSADEIKQYANYYDISLKGTKNADDARGRVKQHLER